MLKYVWSLQYLSEHKLDFNMGPFPRRALRRQYLTTVVDQIFPLIAYVLSSPLPGSGDLKATIARLIHQHRE